MRFGISSFSSALLLFASLGAAAEAVDEKSIIEFSRPLSASEVKRAKLRPFLPARFKKKADVAYFSRLYRSDSADSLKNLEHVRGLHILRHEGIHSVEAANVDPKQATPVGNDPLSIFQWGIKNQKQDLIHDVTDIRSVRVTGKLGQDIDLRPSDIEMIDSRMKSDPIVAVLDTGVSLDHTELKASILRNEKECQGDTFQPASPDEDRDGNGLKGDCAGWNFASKKESGEPRSYDDVGHGTHIAGIITAWSGNGLGVRGLSNRIKILSVKVLARDESGRDPDTKPAKGLSDRVALGILYAVSRGVDVINLSLGWPKASDTEYLRQAVKTAQAAGVMIVAAAGNNSHDGLLFPCAYEGVVCVGATTIDGERAAFSNYGGAVDIMAPGDRILSTIPFKIPPTYMKIPGYDLRDGTSQAAPFVSGALALIKKVFPNEPSNVRLARLQSQALQVKDEALFGLVQIASAVRAEPRPHLVPNFKNLQDVEFDSKSGEFQLNLGVSNQWSAAEDADVRIEIQNPSVRLERESWSWKSFAKNQIEVLKIRGTILDTWTDSKAFLKVSIRSKGFEEHVFTKRLQWVRKIDFKRDAKERKVTWSGAPVSMARQGARGVVSLLFTMDEPGSPSQNALQYVVVPTKDRIELRLFQTGSSEMKELGMIVRPQADRLLEIHRLQVDGMGPKDIVTVTLEKLDPKSTDSENQRIVYCYYQESGVPLYGDRSCLWFKPETAISNPRNQRWVASDFAGKRYLIPVFIDIGKYPLADLPTDEWEQGPNIPTTHLYSLEVFDEKGLASVRDRTFDTLAVRNRWIRSKGRFDISDIRILGLFPQSDQELVQGETRGILSIGKASLKKVYLFRVGANRTFEFEGDAFGSSLIEGLQIENTLSVQNGRITFGHKFAMAGIYDDSRASRTWVSRVNDVPKISATSPTDYLSTFDPLMNPSLSFWNHDSGERVGIYQSKTKTLAQIESADGSTLHLEDLERYSFIAGSVYSELFHPIAVSRQGAVVPALYVDQSQIQSNRVSISLIDSKNGFVRPAALSISLPPECKSLNPSLDEGAKGYQLTLICLNSVGHGVIYDVPLANGGR